MKKKIPIRVTNRTDIFLLSEKQIQSMMRNLLLLLVLVFSAMDLSAQAARGTKTASQNEPGNQNIVHVDQFIAAMRSDNGRTTGAPLRVESLIKDLQPASYVENGSVKTYGGNPVCVFTDASSFASLAGAELPKRDVEMITVKIKSRNDMSRVLDFASLSAFPKLQYVYLVAEFSTTGREIAALVRNNDPKLGVFYNFALTK